MLNLYYGSGKIDKEKYIFDNIKGKTLLIVPDQFSLQAERDAFFYLDKKGLMDLRIVDFSGLGRKVMSQVGGSCPPLIDKYGRHMLIAKIIEERNKKGELTVYSGLSWKNSFVDMMSRLISEIKRHENRPEDLREVLEDLGENGFLKRKVADIEKIYFAYQKAIEDKYLDSEDYIRFYGTKIMNAPMIQEAEIWIYGFDSFDPINKSIIERLLKTAGSVNIVMTYEEGREEFDFTRKVMKDLIFLAEACGEEGAAEEIKGVVRENVWDKHKSGEDSIRLAQTSNPYTEAERAAAFILHLVRDENYKYADMAVICNDMEVRGNILRRILLRWNIPVFMDRRRKVLHHGAVSFLISMMEVISKGYNNEPLIRMLKSGLMNKPLSEIELMENYIKQYRIKGSKWKETFTKGIEQYGEEQLEALEQLRSDIVEVIERARERLGVRNTVESKVKGIYSFLEEGFSMRERLEDLIREQEEDGFCENAAETAQSWNVICNILSQLVETLGEESISNRELTLLMKAGFESVEIGLVPTTSDSILIGSLNRAMVSRKKAIVILGANEGILPKETGIEGLLSEREKEELEAHDVKLAKSQSVEVLEDRLALYRSLFVPDTQLYISCSRANEKGEALSKSRLFETLLKRLLISPYDDLDKEENVISKLTTREGSIGYMAGAFREYLDGEDIDRDWFELMRWYEENELEMLERMKRGMVFDNRMETLGEDFSDALYRGERDSLEVSASRLEKYSSCPFAHFMDYGLRPEELRPFEIGSREIGDLYHKCLMVLSERLTPEESSGLTINHEKSPWMTITRQQCRQEIEDIIESRFSDYREGLLFSGENEAYRRERLLDICDRTAWQMIEQVRKGQIKEMSFEVPFGRGRSLPPVETNVGDRKVQLYGVIDRMDILDSDAARIIDYKTGGNKIKKEYFEEGYKLQLMVYMSAATRGRTLKPAGMFYFKIKELDTDAGNSKAESSNEDLERRLKKAYCLEGIVVNDENLIENMDTEIEKSSSVIPVKRDKTGQLVQSSGGLLLSDEEFKELSDKVDSQVSRICRELYSGKIDVSPAREKDSGKYGRMTACRYCGYKSVCLFDTSFRGCRYREV
ncbi:MAG: hypothetical protein GX663_10070 [Clostridiales bacterium]|nr:hypothetical protein [Clostridiales bacterium]